MKSEQQQVISNLLDLQAESPVWSLDDFVFTVNKWLPRMLPANRLDTRVKDQMTARLVRHYTSMGLISSPARQGKESRYGYRHLLQALVTRKLQAEGVTGTPLMRVMDKKEDAELIAILEGGAELQVTAANPALAYLDQIRQETARQTDSQASPTIKRSPRAGLERATVGESWSRLEVVPGLELHVQEGFSLPSSAHVQDKLMERLRGALLQLTHRKEN